MSSIICRPHKLMDFQRSLPEEFLIDGSRTKKGSEGYVQKGSHPVHGDVAIKRYYVGCCDSEATLLMQNANHKSIVELIGILVDNQSQWIGYVMPYMSIGNLCEIIHNKNEKCDSIYTSEQATRWINYIADGLSYLHSNNIIHRDIKPSNILLGESYDDVRLSDFGIARSIETITHNLTTGIGNPIYMAPEIIKGEYYDISVDIYLFASTIWEILHRRAPFDHVMAKSIYELQMKISDGMRPELDHDLSHDETNLLKRPTINQIQELLTNTRFNISEKETILLLGGQDPNIYSNNMLILTNNEENEMDWKSLDIKLPYAVRNHGAQFLNSHLYIFGGGKVKNECSNSTYKLSKELKWEKVVDLKQKRFRISNSNVILNGRIWVCGGRSGNIVWKSVEMYNPETNEWKYVKEMNECREHAAAAVVNGKILCCGGYDDSKYLDSAECYDPSSDLWIFLPAMPQPLFMSGAVSMDNNFIIMGGRNGKEELDGVWMLNTTNDNAEWIEKQKMPRLRHKFCIARVAGKIFVFGGTSGISSSHDVDISDGETWTNGPRLKVSRIYAATTVIPVKFAKYLEYGNARFQTTLIKTISQQFDETIKVSEIIKTITKKETILLLGGVNTEKSLDSLLILENNGEQWKEAKVKLPFPTVAHGAQFLNDHLYIFGGYNEKNEYLNSTYKLSKRFQWYTLSNGASWEKMTDMNQKRWGISNSSVIFNGRIWVCGGQDGGISLKSVEMYNPETNEWKYMKEMNKCRSDPAAAVIDGKIFCYGGGDGIYHLDSAECYDRSSDIWTLFRPMQEAVQGHGIVGMDRNLVVVGGWIEGDCSKYVWMLDTSDENAKWIEKPKMSFPRGDFSIAKVDNKIFVCGGKSGEDVIDSVEIFDGEIWRNGPNLITPRRRSASIVIPAAFTKCLK